MINIDDLNVLDPQGDTVRLGDVRGERAGLMVLMRHFGCIFCRQRLAQLVAQTEAYPNLDFAVWVIGNGTAVMANDFVQKHGVTRPVYTDPSRHIYEKLGMNRNFGLNFRTLKQSIVAFRQGHRQTEIKGDPWQLGGVVVFNDCGEVIFSVADSEAGSDLPWQDVWAHLPGTAVSQSTQIDA
jgi:peroxiredoxin